MDGLKPKIQKAPSIVKQNMFYNNWQHDHFVSNVFVFCPDGTISICCYIVPGCVHDSKIADIGEIYAKLEMVDYKMIDEGGAKCTVDSDFCRNDNNYLIKSSQTIGVNFEDTEHYVDAAELNRQATSMRQSSEWGMQALHSSFPCL
jgi:hypothetical protein